MDREEIFRKCIRFLAGKPFGGFSLADVAGALSVSKPALYSYFSSKEELVRQTLEYEDRKLRVTGFTVDFSEDFAVTVKKLVTHYITLFSEPETRMFLSCILRLKENEIAGLTSPGDIIWTIESQLFLIFSELEERGRVKFGIEPEAVAHLLALLIFEQVVDFTDTERIGWEAERIASVVKGFMR